MENFKNYFHVKNKKFYSYGKTLIIAEIGSNHNNNFSMLVKLVKIAKRAGCDAVKFQLFKAKNLVQEKSKGYKILKKIELPDTWIPKIKKLCLKENILFACSPFDDNAIELLRKNKCDILKIASPEIKNHFLIKKAIKTKMPIIISTGDSDEIIVKRAFDLVKSSKISNRKISFLHCTSEYPAKIENLNLNMIKFLKKNLKNVPIGFSDHAIGIDSSVSAVAMGACIVEKHITTSRKLNGPDHFFALEPKELIEMVKKIRCLEISFGKYKKERISSENTIYICAFTKKKIVKNSIIKIEDIIFKRTRKKGIGVESLKKILDKKAKKNFKRDEMIILK